MKTLFKLITSIVIIISGLIPIMITILFLVKRKLEALRILNGLPDIVHYLIFMSYVITGLFFTYHGFKYLFKSNGDNSYLS